MKILRYNQSDPVSTEIQKKKKNLISKKRNK